MSKKLYGLVLLGCGSPLVALADVQVTPDTTIGSVMFFDFSHISDQQNGTDVAPTGTGFDVKRFYLSFDHRFNNIWSANLTTDAQYISSPSVTVPTTLPAKATTTSTTNSGAVSEVFIKKLYLQGKFNDGFFLSAGSNNMPWAALAEGLYAYRWVEKTTEDRQGFLNTADWGLHATGTFSDTGIKYAVSVVNGNGFKNPSRSKYVDFEGQVNYTAPIGVTVGVGGYSGHLGQINAANENYPRNNATRFNAIIGYQFAGLRVGGEYFTAKNYKTVNTAAAGVYGTSAVVAATPTGVVPSDKASGGSVWASYAFLEQYSVFARYDDTELSKDVLSRLKDKYFNIGVGYKPLKQLDVALVYKYEKVDNGLTTVSGADANGSYSIGGVNSSTSGKFSEVGAYLAYKF